MIAVQSFNGFISLRDTTYTRNKTNTPKKHTHILLVRTDIYLSFRCDTVHPRSRVFPQLAHAIRQLLLGHTSQFKHRLYSVCPVVYRTGRTEPVTG
ncbi:hypothetical protein J6590_052626 [Homalodisca vitripennis]|nr:hypothetical protein J6590_052626 [Homalodisca vitripennis]